jgi:hypothetical protein
MMRISVMLAVPLLPLAGCSDDSAPVAGDEVGFIQLVDPLDEPEHYCFDVSGQGETLQLDDPAQAHTCKDPEVDEWDDQWFRMNSPEVGMITLEEHDRCVQAAGTVGGSEILFEDCDPSEALQWWELTTPGLVCWAETPRLCWAVRGGKRGEPGGGDSNLRRDVTLETCTSVDAIYATWAVPGGSLGSP